MKFNSAGQLVRGFKAVEISDFWTVNDGDNLKMHKIHWYPAKFPAFLVNKAFEHAKSNGIKINNVIDFFCGCGTTSLESKRSEYNFWGCDINPVATLITKVKSTVYDSVKLNELYDDIVAKFDTKYNAINSRFISHERIRYWFTDEQIIKLERLLLSIKDCEAGDYQDFFLCAFSNILRGCSRWLTKSIKPQVDPDKIFADVLGAFKKQFQMMLKANDELIKYKLSPIANIVIENQSIFDINPREHAADIIITSPPYVTSYEYADLHQLSTLWLEYVDDYRTLRQGTVGSLYNSSFVESMDGINNVGQTIIDELNAKAKNKSKSTLKYFYDLKHMADKAFSLLTDNGMAYFVIGNTQYNGVMIDNAKYLSVCLLESGFDEVEIFKREIGNKILTRNRDKKGRFTVDPEARKVYNVEYVVIARKR